MLSMKLHPAVIASEIKNYSFFRKFSEDLLLQVSTMTDVLVVKQGDLILKEGDVNYCLYFIRSGRADVLLAGEVVATLTNQGDVFGEMSVVSENKVTTSIRAATDIECFVLDSRNFNHVHPKDKDHFLSILYRLYSIILADRLIKTNEKARLFEIANRELYQAQQSLVGFADKKILLIESDKKQLVLAKMAVGGTGVNLEIASDLPSATQFIESQVFDAIMCNHDCLDSLQIAKLSNLNSEAKLMYLSDKDLPETFEALKKFPYVNNLISRDEENRTDTVKTILTAMSKIFSQDMFGLEKYQTSGVTIYSKIVKSSDQRSILRDDLMQFLKSLGLRNTFIERCDMVAEELLMNAIYDAPTDANGKPLFNHFQRQQEVFLDSHQQAMLRYSCDGVAFAISVMDPFGSLEKSTLLKYLEKCFQGHSGHADEHIGQKGGAGRGLHQIIENSDLTIFNVKKGIRSEVVCLFYLESSKRSSKPSFHFFFS